MHFLNDTDQEAWCSHLSFLSDPDQTAQAWPGQVQGETEEAPSPLATLLPWQAHPGFMVLCPRAMGMNSVVMEATCDFNIQSVQDFRGRGLGVHFLSGASHTLLGSVFVVV